MLMIEGPDNAGKTTLIRQLVGLDPSLRVIRRERYNPKHGENIGDSYLACLTPPDGDREAHARGLLDRSYPSECIYGALYRGGCRMTPQQHFAIKAILLSYGTLVVVCDPPDDAITRTWHEREQTYDKDPLEIAHAYRQRIAALVTPMRVIRYDWTRGDADEQREMIIAAHDAILLQYHLQLDYPFTPCDATR